NTDQPVKEEKIARKVNQTPSPPSPLPASSVLNIDSAESWTKRWRENGRSYMSDQNNALPLAFVTGIEDFQSLLAEKPVADSIRAYLAIDDKGVLHLVYVGVDSSGTDLTSGGNDAIYDLTFVCPPVCDTSSVLCNCPFSK
ncbi:MAG: hypothetical protein AAFP19_26090, partial [Bacteroidota bacterium]